jgi:hypothetical protein
MRKTLFMFMVTAGCASGDNSIASPQPYMCDTVYLCNGTTVGRGTPFASATARSEADAAEEFRGAMLAMPCVERPLADAKCWTEADYPGPFDPTDPGKGGR